MELDNKDAASKADFVQLAYNMFQEGVLQPPPIRKSNRRATICCIT
jgi:hypothetical protein